MTADRLNEIRPVSISGLDKATGGELLGMALDWGISANARRDALNELARRTVELDVVRAALSDAEQRAAEVKPARLQLDNAALRAEHDRLKRDLGMYERANFENRMRADRAEQRAVQAEKELSLSKKFADDLFDLERKAEARLAETLTLLAEAENRLMVSEGDARYENANIELGKRIEAFRAALTPHPADE